MLYILDPNSLKNLSLPSYRVTVSVLGTRTHSWTSPNPGRIHLKIHITVNLGCEERKDIRKERHWSPLPTVPSWSKSECNSSVSSHSSGLNPVISTHISKLLILGNDRVDNVRPSIWWLTEDEKSKLRAASTFKCMLFWFSCSEARDLSVDHCQPWTRLLACPPHSTSVRWAVR